jgi:hypothetical protein
MRKIFVGAATALVTILGFAAPALGAPGDLHESSLYKSDVDLALLKCPEGTARVLEEKDRQLVESCYDDQGKRRGYYLAWHTDGDRWAVLGAFDNGKPVGRWLEFDKAGDKVAVRYYKGGQLKNRHTL